jgi:15-cis-phytoene synthase
VTPDQYCAEKAASSGSSFYYAFRFLPPPRRRAITALYAFCREVDDAVDETADAHVARVKLDYWRKEIQALFDGRASHPVALALEPIVAPYAIGKDDLLTVIDGMQMDLERTRYATWSELTEYCHRVAGVVGWMSANIFGATDGRTREYAHALGLAFQLTNIIRDVGEDAQRGRIYLPLADLAECGVSQADILKLHASEGFIPLMRMQTERARALYTQAFAALPDQDRLAQRPGLIMASIYQRILNDIERRNFPVLKERVSIAPITKLFLALSTWVKP